MTAYAIGNLRPTPDVHEDVVVYIERVQDTLDPFGGRFLVHGGAPAGRTGGRLARGARPHRLPLLRARAGLVRLPRLPGADPAAL